MERLLLWFLEGLAEVRQPAGTAGGLRPVTGGLLGFAEKGWSLSRLGQRLLARWRAEAFLSRGPDL